MTFPAGSPLDTGGVCPGRAPSLSEGSLMFSKTCSSLASALVAACLIGFSLPAALEAAADREERETPTTSVKADVVTQEIIDSRRREAESSKELDDAHRSK